MLNFINKGNNEPISVIQEGYTYKLYYLVKRMKKIILVLLACFCLTSCWTYTKYKVNCKYQVCYPDTTITYDTIFNCRYDSYLDDSIFKVYTSSYKGTNYINIYPGGISVVYTTSPIRIISYKKLQ